VIRRAVAVAGLLAAATAAHAEPAAEVAAQAERIVENYRRAIVLHEAPPAGRQREATVAGLYLYYENRRAVASLVQRLVDPQHGDEYAEALVRQLRERADWRDLDRLALAGVVNEALLYRRAGSAGEDDFRKLQRDFRATRAAYDAELTGALAERAAGPAHRPAWNAYLASLRQQYPPARILEELKAPLERAPSPPLSAERAGALDSALRDEWTDGGLPPRTLLLTFDDGPHPQYTPRVLDVLDRFGVKAVFFLVGRNLGAVRDGRAENLRNTEIVRDILRRGHAIANHSMSHPFLPKLDEVHVAEEIDDAEDLLAAATAGAPARAPLFRPPYGARNALVLADAAERGLRSVLWNIDSRDWADPIPRSIAGRVAEEAEREGRGIILFHDIHLRTVEALPLALEALVKHGFSFAYWDGSGLAAPSTPKEAR
jgi:peptidoglycan/xylan/chitin deacetylase (PgdA/CDA1 family)